MAHYTINLIEKTTGRIIATVKDVDHWTLRNITWLDEDFYMQLDWQNDKESPF